MTSAIPGLWLLTIPLPHRGVNSPQENVRLKAPLRCPERPVVGAADLEGVKSDRHGGSGSLAPKVMGDSILVFSV
jgi:hypothetical protein